MNLFLAAATGPTQTAMERLRAIPTEFWVKIGIGVVGLILVVLVLRKVAKVNKVVLAVGSALALSILGFTWVYERNEPSWATPVVSWLAEFFPSKGRVRPTIH
ncbi:MAG: hypothetical protein V4773_00270 [Verrucomicrobiota bacterium]